MNFDTVKKMQEENQSITQNYGFANNSFDFGIALLDSHIKDVLKTCEASYSQVALASLTTFGFVLAHAGMKKTSLYFLDLSNSGTGKSHNMTLQVNLLLNGIIKIQEKSQQAYDNESELKRFNNIHRGKITVPALNQCIKSVSSQFVIIDELGMLMARNDEIIDEITKLYGVETTSLSVTKSEAPSSQYILPVQFSFIGATTLTYLGGSKALHKHLGGGFINRAFLAYNTILKSPQEITSIYKDNLDYDKSNQVALKIYYFAKNFKSKLIFTKASEDELLSFKREIQTIRIKYNEIGSELGSFYTRIEQNTHIVINILHLLKCYEKGSLDDEIGVEITTLAINFIKNIVFVELDKLINYLNDGELLEREEKQKAKIVQFVETYRIKHNKMPKIRDVAMKTRLSKSQILELIKDYLEIVPCETTLRYCQNISKGF